MGHVAGNIDVLPLHLNYLKHTYPPEWINVIGLQRFKICCLQPEFDADPALASTERNLEEDRQHIFTAFHEVRKLSERVHRILSAPCDSCRCWCHTQIILVEWLAIRKLCVDRYKKPTNLSLHLVNVQGSHILLPQRFRATQDLRTLKPRFPRWRLSPRFRSSQSENCCS